LERSLSLTVDAPDVDTEAAVDTSALNAEENCVVGRGPLGMEVVAVDASFVVQVFFLAKFDDFSPQIRLAHFKRLTLRQTPDHFFSATPPLSHAPPSIEALTTWRGLATENI
jgi:hypothetical protein